MSLNDPHWGRGGSDDNEEKKSEPDKENRSDTDRKDERGQNGFENKEAGKRKNEERAVQDRAYHKRIARYSIGFVRWIRLAVLFPQAAGNNLPCFLCNLL